MKLTLLRHGTTEATKKGLYCGVSDVPLCPDGISELQNMSARFSYPKAEVCFTSGLLRTEQTLEILYGKVPHTRLPAIRETDFGHFEMRGFAGDLENDPEFWAWCEHNTEQSVCPGGESARQTTERALAAFCRILKAGQDAVCITHGGVIAKVMSVWFPGAENRYVFTPKPGTGYQIMFCDEAPVSYFAVPTDLCVNAG